MYVPCDAVEVCGVSGGCEGVLVGKKVEPSEEGVVEVARSR